MISCHTLQGLFVPVFRHGLTISAFQALEGLTSFHSLSMGFATSLGYQALSGLVETFKVLL